MNKYMLIHLTNWFTHTIFEFDSFVSPLIADSIAN